MVRNMSDRDRKRLKKGRVRGREAGSNGKVEDKRNFKLFDCMVRNIVEEC